MGMVQSNVSDLDIRKLELEERRFDHQMAMDKENLSIKHKRQAIEESSIKLRSEVLNVKKKEIEKFAENPLYCEYLANSWRLTTPYEQLTAYTVAGGFVLGGLPAIRRAYCAWRVPNTTDPAQLKKLAKALSLKVTDLPSPLDPVAVARFVRVYTRPGAAWASVPIFALLYMVRARDASLVYGQSRLNSKI